MSFTRAVIQGARPGWRVSSPQPKALALRRRGSRRSASTPSRPATAPARSRATAKAATAPSASMQHRFSSSVVGRMESYSYKDLETMEMSEIDVREAVSSHCAWAPSQRAENELSLPRRPIPSAFTSGERWRTLESPQLAAKWMTEGDEDTIAPTPEFTNRYARVPSVYSVIQGFSAVRSPEPSPVYRAAEAVTDSEGEEGSEEDELSEEEEARKRQAMQCGGGYVGTSALCAFFSGAEFSATAVADAHRMLQSRPLHTATKKEKQSPTRWSLSTALNRVRNFLGGHAREPLSARPLDYCTYTPAHKLPFYARRADASRGHESDSDSEHEHEHERAPPMRMAGIARNLSHGKFFTATQRCGAAILSSLSMRPPASALGPAAAFAAPDASMPDATALDESSAYDESSTGEEHRGDRSNEDFSEHPHERTSWKQDAFSQLPASLLRFRPESEFPSSYRRKMGVEMAASPTTGLSASSWGSSPAAKVMAARPQSAAGTCFADRQLNQICRLNLSESQLSTPTLLDSVSMAALSQLQQSSTQGLAYSSRVI